MKLPSLFQFRILKEALTALFTGPYTTKFPYQPYTAPEAYRGAPEYSEEGCVGCKACVEACPALAIEYKDKVDKGKKTGKRTLTLDYATCQFCGTCERVCITEEGIKLSNKYDLAVLDKKDAVIETEKELALCELCGEIITTKAHLQWLVKKLGALAFTNPNLVLANQEQISALQKKLPPEEKEITRADQMRLLCPKCRRKVFLKEEGD